MATPIALRDEYITLSQALKVAGIAGTGGHAKVAIRAGQFRVNGEVELRPGRKLRAGDRLTDEHGAEWLIQKNGSETVS
jgi:ribosome-associated protein